MNVYVEKYINTKRVTKRLNAPLTIKQIEGLTKVIEEYGVTAFIRGKSCLSPRAIEDTIPTMLANGISTIVENLAALKNIPRNSYAHYELLYGENAKSIYTQRTTKSLISLDGFIKRHGKEIGTEKYKQLLQKRVTQNTLEGFIKRHGKETGEEKYFDYKMKLQYKNTLAYYIENFGEDLGERMYQERYPSDYNLNLFQDYKKSVYKLSNKTYTEHKNKINPNNYPRTRMGVNNGWQLDHIKSVKQCFKEGISIEEAADVTNLRMLPWKENLMRNFDDQD